PGQGTAPNCAGPINGGWSFLGPDNTNGTVYSTNGFTAIPGGNEIVSDSMPINPSVHANRRYFRYQIFLIPCNPPDANCLFAPESPVITDVILNWSP
ncbi:MAG: hypothetical protein AAB518_04275, partial [Patescibacteria group bacterium]